MADHEENQKRIYNSVIDDHLGWKFTGIYMDKVVSGTGRGSYTEFNRMMEDAKAGKVDFDGRNQ